MKALHIINNLGSGGAESMLLNFVKNADSSFAYDILLLENELVVYDVPKSITIHTLPQTQRYSFFKLYYLYKFLKNKSYAIIHTHLFPTQYYVALATLLLRKKPKLVTTEHNTTNNRRKYQLTRLLDRFIYRQYHRIIFISKAVQEQFKQDFPSLNTKGTIINNGIPLQQFYPSKAISTKEKETRIIMVARFSEQKDHTTLLQALKLLDETYTLSLVGEGPKINEIKNLAQKLSIAERVHFLGFRKDIADLYRKHDLFVLSSHWEGFGLVAAEAMASGLPVVTTDVEGLREVVKDAGLTVEPYNARELANKIKQIATNTAQRELLIKKGLERAKKYDIKNLREHTEKLYKQLLKE